jgi:tRNA-dihydrouridine synthase 1
MASTTASSAVTTPMTPVEEADVTKSVSGNDAAGNGEVKMREKLHGRKFYESIGSPKFVLAPMVDQSEFVS